MDAVGASRVLSLCQRVAAAVVGGYTLSIAVSGCLSLVLPLARADAVLTGLLVSFLVYAAAVLWAFSVRSLPQMWAGIGTATTAFGLVALLFAPDGAS